MFVQNIWNVPLIQIKLLRPVPISDEFWYLYRTRIFLWYVRTYLGQIGTYIGHVYVGATSGTYHRQLCTYIGHVYFGAAAIHYVIRMTVSVRKKKFERMNAKDFCTV